MKILLVSATKLEVDSLIRNCKKVQGNPRLFGGRIGKHSVDVLVTGVGMTATAFHLGRSLSKEYDLAINAGVAGSFDRSIDLGTVVNVVSDAFADLGAEDGERFLSLKEMGLGQTPSPKFQAQSPKLKGKGQNFMRGLRKVKGITVNTVHGNPSSIKKVVRKFAPDVESMEGAAFFFACGEFEIPYVQIRAISNYVERRNRKNWKLELAIRNLNVCLEQLLNSI